MASNISLMSALSICVFALLVWGVTIRRRKRNAAIHVLTGSPYFRAFFGVSPFLGFLSALIALGGGLFHIPFSQIVIMSSIGIAGTVMLTTIIHYTIVRIEIFIGQKKLGARSGYSRRRKQRLSRDKLGDLLQSLSFCIPRKHREAVIGDLVEDCREMRDLGMGTTRICINLLVQLVIAFALLRLEDILSFFFKAKKASQR